MSLLPKRTKISSEDVDMQDDKTRDLSLTNLEEVAIVTDADMNTDHVKEYVKDLAFMEDILTFMIGYSPDKNDTIQVSCGVNGIKRTFERNREYKAERKFVDALMCIVTEVETQTYKDAKQLDDTRMLTKFRPRHFINILHDPAGQVGQRWFEHKQRYG